MFAKVLRLRSMGVLMVDPATPTNAWASGIFEFSAAIGELSDRRTRRLVLRHAMANPDKGIVFELFEPRLVDVREPWLRFRGVEPVSIGDKQLAAVVQDWLVRFGA